MERISRLVHAGVASTTLILAACASTGPAPVDDLSGDGARRSVEPVASVRAPPAGAGRHRVRAGDTLYSIAFRNGVDFRDLAAWNRIGPPYTIYVGQDLLTRAPAGARGATPPAASTRTAPAAVPAKPPVEPRAAVAVPAPFESVEGAVATRVPAAPAPAVPAPATPPPAPVAAPAPPAAAASTVVGNVSWRWPADGTLVGTFAAGNPTRQGIDIGGRAGDPVRAAADGSVVYSGNGLIGYGELVIVKHNASYLSAYGHNRKRLVKEGDRVRAGQVIAEMGSSGANRDSLHFEIRRNGKPANPLEFLPRR